MINNHVLDGSILVGYLIFITAFGVWVGRKSGGTQVDYFLGGRKLGWFAIGASVFATNISITQFMSGSGLAHRIGLASINNDLIGGLLLAISGLLFVPIYIRSRIYTMPQFLERRYGRPARLIYGWTYVVQQIMAMPTGFYVGGLAMLGLFNLDASWLPIACLVIGLTVGTYSIFGGLTSVVMTDAVQVLLLIAGGLAVTFIGMDRAGGFAALYGEFAETHFELLLPRGTAMPWSALPGIALHSCFFAFASVHIIQRVLGARNLHHARCGMAFAGWLKLLAIPLFALPGIIALKLYPEASGDATYAYLIRDLLPAGISGLVMAGMMAALMSSADSGVCALSSVVAIDLYPSFSKKPNEQTALRIGKWTATLVMVFGVLMAPHYQKLGAIYPFILRLSGFAFLPIAVCFVFGRFYNRVNGTGALACLISGSILGFGYVFATAIPAIAAHMPAWVTTPHFYEVLPGLFLFCTVVLFLVSRLSRPPSAEHLAVLTERESTGLTGEEGLPLWRTFNFWFAALLGVTGMIYLFF
jgi:SSS family solute:Na+ symporter